MQWIKDRELGPELIHAFVQANDGNGPATCLLELLQKGNWTFALFPAHWDENIEEAVGILEMSTCGFVVAIVMVEIFVDPYAFIIF